MNMKKIKVDVYITYDGRHYDTNYLDTLTGYPVHIPSDNDNLITSLADKLRSRCLIENGICESELLYNERHKTNIDDIYLKNIEVGLFYEGLYTRFIGFQIIDSDRHENIGFDHLYDDSEYPNDF